ncbi:UNVERIFIED_CONTAM: hypothetical protein H355_012285 [Colinus virginianus]|nr:hypothetical protein H355_012285 [Colinus virginianus]
MAAASGSGPGCGEAAAAGGKRGPLGIPEAVFVANVMLEYDIDEAQALLEKNLSTATRNLDSLEEDLDFLRDQFTTTEFCFLNCTPSDMARVYNWDVKRRNKEDPSKNKA